ncbi:MAG: hypothetical protein ACTHXV_09310, partial [Canibacter sp.]
WFWGLTRAYRGRLGARASSIGRLHVDGATVDHGDHLCALSGQQPVVERACFGAAQKDTSRSADGCE